MQNSFSSNIFKSSPSSSMVSTPSSTMVKSSSSDTCIGLKVQNIINWGKRLMKRKNKVIKPTKVIEPMTVNRLLNMTKEEIGQLTIRDYKPVDVVWMLLEEIKRIKGD